VEVGLQPVVEEQLQSFFTLKPMKEEELQQPIVQEQPQPILASRPMEEKELQQPMSRSISPKTL
jgi:hypothetical protein